MECQSEGVKLLGSLLRCRRGCTSHAGHPSTCERLCGPAPALVPGYERCQGSYGAGRCEKPPPGVTCTPDPQQMARLAGQAWKAANAVGGLVGGWAVPPAAAVLKGVACTRVPAARCEAPLLVTAAERRPPRLQGYKTYDIRQSTLMNRANGLDQRAKVGGRWLRAAGGSACPAPSPEHRPSPSACRSGICRASTRAR